MHLWTSSGAPGRCLPEGFVSQAARRPRGCKVALRRARVPTSALALLASAMCFAWIGCTEAQPPAVSGQSPPVSQDLTPERVTPLTKPWQRVIPLQETPEGLPSLRASHCGACHTAIYEEWAATTHAVALQDLQFQAEWKKDGELWLCLNCHTPLENQMERLVTGLADGDFRTPVVNENPEFDPVLQAESITCAVCHVRGGAILGPGLDGDTPHLVQTREGGFFQRTCEHCHNMQDRLTDTLICTFNTGDEWRASGRAAQGQGCVDCHMPAVTRPLVEGGDDRPGHRHTWFGAGIAKFPSDVETVRAAYHSGYDIELRAVHHREPTRPERVSIDLAIINSRAGHELPTGDPERFITLELLLRDGRGSRLWAHTERIGELWQWYPKAEQLSDNSLKPGERRELSFDVPLPPAAGGGLRVELVARNHRMTEENARAMGIQGRYPLAVETWRQTVPVGSN